MEDVVQQFMVRDLDYVTPKLLQDMFPGEAKFSGMELTFIMDDGGEGFAVRMKGYYEINEMKAITAELELANQFFTRIIPQKYFDDGGVLRNG